MAKKFRTSYGWAGGGYQAAPHIRKAVSQRARAKKISMTAAVKRGAGGRKVTIRASSPGSGRFSSSVGRAAHRLASGRNRRRDRNGRFA